MYENFEGSYIMEQTLLTSAQRRKLAENNRKIQLVRELIGTKVQVNNGEMGELIGWRFNSDAEFEYVIRLWADDRCELISEKDFQERGYVFIG